MKRVEAENEELKGVLPKTYTKIENSTLVSLLKNFSQIAVDDEGDKFGKIYEYFLGNFARAEGQRGGEFFTPTSLVTVRDCRTLQLLFSGHRSVRPLAGAGKPAAQAAGRLDAALRPHSVADIGRRSLDFSPLCLLGVAPGGSGKR